MSLKLLVLLLCMTGQPVNADYFFDGNWLQGQCDDEARYPSCNAYIIGAMDGSDAGAATLYCWPEKGTLGQAIDIVKKWLDDNPSLRTMSGGRVVISALKEAFPTRVMWQPSQEDENGDFLEAPLTQGKSTDRGEWVATCSGEVVHNFAEFFWFAVGLPENYELGKTWSLDLLRGPE